MVIERRLGKEVERKYKESEKGAPPSVFDILRNSQQSEILLTILQGAQQEDLARKILRKETLDADKLKSLEGYRQKVKEALDRSAEIMKILEKPGMIERMANASESFAKIVGLIGPQKTQEFLKNYLALLYAEDSNKFQNLAEKIKGINQGEQKLKEIDNQLRGIAKKYKIPEKELEEALASENPKDALTKLVKDHRGFIGRIRDWLTSGKLTEKRVNELNKVEEIDKILNGYTQNNQEIRGINSFLGEIGNMIGEAFSVSQRAPEIINKIIYEEQMPKPTLSFIEAGRRLPTQKQLRENLFNEWKEAYNKETDKEIGANNPEQITEDVQRNSFLDYLNKKFGWGLFKKLFMEMIKNLLWPPQQQTI